MDRRKKKFTIEAESPEARAAMEEAELQAMRQQYYMDSNGLFNRGRSINASMNGTVNASINREVTKIYHRFFALQKQGRITTQRSIDLNLTDALSALKEMDPANMDFAYAGKLINVAVRIYGCRVDDLVQQTEELYNEVLQYVSEFGSQNETVSATVNVLAHDNAEKQQSTIATAGMKKLKQTKIDIYCQNENDLAKIKLNEEEFGPVNYPDKQLRKGFNASGASNSYEVLNDFGRAFVVGHSPEQQEWPAEKNQPCARRYDKILARNEELDCLISTLPKKLKYTNTDEAPSFRGSISSFHYDGESTINAISSVEHKDSDANVVLLQKEASMACALEVDNNVPFIMDYKSAYQALSTTDRQYSYLNIANLPLFCGPTPWKAAADKLNGKNGRRDSELEIVKVKKRKVGKSFGLTPTSDENFKTVADNGDEVTLFKKETLHASNPYGIGPEKPCNVSVFLKSVSYNNPLVSRSTQGDADYKPFRELSKPYVNNGLSYGENTKAEDSSESSTLNDDTLPTENDNSFGDELTDIGINPSRHQMELKKSHRRFNTAKITDVMAELMKNCHKQQQVNEVTTVVNSTGTSKDRVEPRDFSEIYRILTRKPNIGKEITVPTAFVSLLHICSEQSLLLADKGDGDITIQNLNIQ